MLIHSERIRQEDLELWNEYEEADLAHYRCSNFGKKEAHAMQEIKDFCQNPSGYIGISWGKDSVVTAHLCYRACVKMPYIWIVAEGVENPDCYVVRNEFLKLFDINYVEVATDYRGVGTGRLKQGFKDAAKRYGDRYISGVRGSESSIRAMSIGKLGLSSDRVCRPIGYWKENDVFAYLAHYNLPVHPVYAMLGGGRWRRDKIRTASIGGERGSGIGRTEWEREYYSDILNRIAVKRYEKP